MKVLGLASYPVEAAGTRYRLVQFVEPLAERGIVLSIRPFLESQSFEALYKRKSASSTSMALLKSSLRRVADIFSLSGAEVVLVQREAMIFGPPIFEWIAARVLRRPMVLDLDDATYVPYTSPTYGNLGKKLKWFSKTDDLIRWARLVTCGNNAVADYVRDKGAIARVIPTVVDTEIFVPRQESTDGPLLLGWIGTHSTFPYLETIFPVLQELARKHRFVLKIVGAGKQEINLPGVDIENLEWNLQREVADFQSLHIGLYPIDSTLYPEQWAAGKSGFKAIQYMAVGIPFVASPVGAITEVGRAGVTHYQASTNEEWLSSLDRLLSDAELRRRMGNEGRAHAVQNYGLADQADKLARCLFEAAGEGKTG